MSGTQTCTSSHVLLRQTDVITTEGLGLSREGLFSFTDVLLKTSCATGCDTCSVWPNELNEQSESALTNGVNNVLLYSLHHHRHHPAELITRWREPSGTQRMIRREPPFGLELNHFQLFNAKKETTIKVPQNGTNV